ncbi:MAG: nucleotide sugar dehydrogenase [Acidimicrobiales bacterium]
MTKLVVIGQGYVGIPLSVRAAEVGFEVVGFDIDKDRIDQLHGGDSPVEDITSERLAAVRADGSYTPTSDPDDLAGFHVAVISVPTPLRDHQPDLGHIEEAGRTLASRLTPGATVVLESTTWPGTTDELLRPILEAGSGLVAGTDFHLGYSPERVDPGNTTWTLENTPKVVSGIDAASLAAVEAFFDAIVETTVAVPTTREAELAKLLENTFRHVNIALVNELAMFAGDLGIDIWATIDAASTKPFGFMRFTPGPGVGGHCLPIDPSYLSWRVKQSLGQAFRFVELANDINDHMPDYVIRRLTAALNDRELSVKGRRILVLGLSYKRDTGDARQSPSQPICRQLVALGADVRAVDPHVAGDQTPPGVTRVELTADELRAADSVLVLVDHSEFDPALVAREAQHVLDTRHWLGPGPGVEHL